MTGFGRASGRVGERFLLTVVARSVNHRYLEVSVRLPEAFWEMEPALRALASETFHRGKVDLSVRAERVCDPEYDVRLSRNLAGRVLPQLKGLLEEFGIDAKLSASDLLRIPDLLQVVPREEELDASEQEAVRSVVSQAFQAMAGMRKTEGEALHRDITGRLAEVREAIARLGEMRDTVREESLQSYRQRVDELARSSGVTIDPDRLAQETVLLVEKSDIAEELARAESHLAQIDAVIASPEPAGKKLDFLSQELLREINTSGQKSRSAAIRTVVVELKTGVERIREQVQNVE